MLSPPISIILPIKPSHNLPMQVDQLQHLLRFCDELILLEEEGQPSVVPWLSAICLPESNIRLQQTPSSFAQQYQVATQGAVGAVFLFLPQAFELASVDWRALLHVLSHEQINEHALWGSIEPQPHGPQKGFRKLLWSVRHAWYRWTKSVSCKHPLWVSKALFQQVQGFGSSHEHPWFALIKRIKKQPHACFVCVKA